MDNNLKIPECCSEVVSFEANDAEYVISYENSPNAEASQVEIVIIVPEAKDIPNSITSLQTLSPPASPKPRGKQEVQSPPTSLRNPETLALSIKKNFIRKVLMILMTQMLISIVFVTITFIPGFGVKGFLKTRKYLMLIAMLLILISFVLILCKKEAVQKVPHNYILLFAFTSGLSYVLAYVASFTESFIVLITACLTLVIVLAAIVFACRMKAENSRMLAFLYQTIPLLVLLAIIGFVFPKLLIKTLISTAVVVVIAIHLTFSIHGLISTSDENYTVDDYVLAAIHIYMNIYIIFVKVITLLSLIFRPSTFQ